MLDDISGNAIFSDAFARRALWEDGLGKGLILLSIAREISTY